jgi:hypothetical protein
MTVFQAVVTRRLNEQDHQAPRSGHWWLPLVDPHQSEGKLCAAPRTSRQLDGLRFATREAGFFSPPCRRIAGNLSLWRARRSRPSDAERERRTRVPVIRRLLCSSAPESRHRRPTETQGVRGISDTVLTQSVASLVREYIGEHRRAAPEANARMAVRQLPSRSDTPATQTRTEDPCSASSASA